MCFMLYLKIINNFQKYDLSILKEIILKSFFAVVVCTLKAMLNLLSSTDNNNNIQFSAESIVKFAIYC